MTYTYFVLLEMVKYFDATAVKALLLSTVECLLSSMIMSLCLIQFAKYQFEPSGILIATIK